MKREKSGCQKEVVHRIKFDATHGSNDQHDKEEKEERHWREETDLTGQGPGLKFFRHDHRDLITRNQILVRPHQIPAVATQRFLRRRKGVVRKINVLKVGL